MNLKELKKLIKGGDDNLDISSLFKGKETIKAVNPEMTTEIPVEEGACVQIRHSVNSGDLIAAMGCIKKYHEITKRRAVVLQTVDFEAAYYHGAEHPLVNSEGKNVTMNDKMFDMLKPLIESQGYINSMVRYSGQRIDIDFDTIRGKTFVNMPHGNIQGWLPLAFPDLAFDISKPWVHLDDSKCPLSIRGAVAGKILLNFTARYRAKIDYFFLQNFSSDLIFTGTEKEYCDFCNKWGLVIPRLEIDNFLDLAYAIKEARFFVGNQSFGWNITQAIGTPRILEMCNYADNCFPGIGENSVGYFYQVAAEHYFRTYYNDTLKKPQ